MSLLQRLRPVTSQILRNSRVSIRCISNTPKSNDYHASTHSDEPAVKSWQHPSTELPKEYKEWTPFLYPFDKEKDEFVRRGIMFSVIVVMFCWVPFLWAYGPDHSLQNWSYREAFLEIERRRKNGEPLISPDLVDPKKVAAQLPSDEELGDMEIII